jgi:hypothetical protein
MCDIYIPINDGTASRISYAKQSARHALWNTAVICDGVRRPRYPLTKRNDLRAVSKTLRLEAPEVVFGDTTQRK